MTSGNEIVISNLLSYPILVGSIAAVIVSTIFLLTIGKQLNKFTKRLMIALLIIALATTLYLLHMAFVFGNPHPSASPVPLS